MSPAKPLEPDERAARIERVLEQCEDLFFTYGFKRVSVDEIVKQLGMSKKTLYQLIPTKDALIEAFVARMLQRRHQLLKAAADKNNDILTATATILGHIRSDRVRISAAMAMDLERHWPELFARIEEDRQEDIRGFIERLSDNERGYLRAGLHPAVLVHVIETMVMRVLTPKMLGELNVSMAQAIGTVMGVLLEGILSDKGRRRLSAARKSND